MTTCTSKIIKFGEDGLQPMNPSSQCLNTSYLSLGIIGIAESEIPIDVEKVMVPLRTDLLRVNPAFSSVVVRKHGKQWWKRVEVQYEDHVIVPTFPQGLSPESYTQYFEEYLSKICLDKLSETRPLWELHIIKYPTQGAAGTFAFKMHHALGDGFSIMGALFSTLKRADNTSLPLTFPSTTSRSKEKRNICKSGLNFISGCFNTINDIVSNMMHTAWFGDRPSAIRSGAHSVECLPVHITRITFSLDDISQVRTKLGVTVNDVIIGIIFHGTHLYTKSVDEMLQNNMWGNQFSFIHIPIPSYSDGQKVDLKDFILQAQKIIQRNKTSMAVHINGLLLSLMGSLRGTEAVSKYVHSTLKNTSFTVSNLIGPTEKMAYADHPISNLYFTVTGSPQSLVFLVMSYLGKLTITISGEKGFIDLPLLVSCMNKAFEKIVKEAST
ncbi:O-acyltransferase (WSD1-like) family protein [Thalictrum thalictroides]|uniref:O-acyltransferase (WSD1-like) family protein n=1 Tax=Thalictrum thalictroides TaxID=46969 RepID=A0A7J6UVN2_THATH|nr:O-acyltransferase (WSD1-like) family protein [Thalictrum thalictroides]